MKGAKVQRMWANVPRGHLYRLSPKGKKEYSWGICCLFSREHPNPFTDYETIPVAVVDMRKEAFVALVEKAARASEKYELTHYGQTTSHGYAKAALSAVFASSKGRR